MTSSFYVSYYLSWVFRLTAGGCSPPDIGEATRHHGVLLYQNLRTCSHMHILTQLTTSVFTYRGRTILYIGFTLDVTYNVAVLHELIINMVLERLSTCCLTWLLTGCQPTDRHYTAQGKKLRLPRRMKSIRKQAYEDVTYLQQVVGFQEILDGYSVNNLPQVIMQQLK